MPVEYMSAKPDLTRAGSWHVPSSSLRDAVQDITERSKRGATKLKPRSNVVVSHPPSPTSLLAVVSADQLRPLHDIEPLDPSSLARIPLSRPSSENLSTRFDRAVLAQDEWPLILVTGGCGFIGSHTILEILQEGKYGVVAIDNLANADEEVLSRVRALAAAHHEAQGRKADAHPPLYFHKCDITSPVELEDVFMQHVHQASTSKSLRSRIVASIHFAALKSVAESIAQPLAYYHVNVSGTVLLAEQLSKWNVKKIVFSSSCVVYGEDKAGRGIVESDWETGGSSGGKISNSYGKTKRVCEEILADLARADPDWQTMALRYTNPSGAHPSGHIGEDPRTAANLMPIVTQVLQGRRESVQVFGTDYDTLDGTAIRDFIHVVDLAKAHLAALEAVLNQTTANNYRVYNLGTNKGTSVLEVIQMLSVIAQRPIKIVVSPRRPGDLACVVCSADKAYKELGWRAERDLGEMCRDLVNWMAMNPEGYRTGSQNGSEQP